MNKHKDKYRIFFENSQDAMLIIKNGLFIDCNNTAVKMLGYNSKKEILNKQPSTLSPKFQPDGIASDAKAECMIELTLNHKSHVFEWLHKRKDGTTFPVEVSLTVIEEGDDIIINTIWRNIAQRKKTEKELLRMQKLQSLGVLAGGIAHDFNNIMCGVYGNISLAKNKITENIAACNYLSRAEKSIENAKYLIDQLLHLSKSTQLLTEELRLENLIYEAIDFNVVLNNVQAKVNLCNDLWSVFADKSKLQQVVSNLIINAVQAMPNGGVVDINLQNIVIPDDSNLILRPGKYVSLSIRDEGHGISEEHLEDIFDPYFTTKKQGNGLGLAVVHSIIDKHNGLIEVSSKINTGTTFTIYIPAEPLLH